MDKTIKKSDGELDPIAIRLDAERKREIDEVKQNFEIFYREEIKFQADMKNKMDLVTEGQRNLRERFEQGTAKTLAELKRSFDEFRVEWGSKKKEDEIRDQKLVEVKDLAHSAHSKHDWIIRGIIFVVFTAIIIALIKVNFIK